MVLFSTKATSILSCAETGENVNQYLLDLRLMGFALLGLLLGAQESARQAVLSVMRISDFVADTIFSACSVM
jgi:hypothetical protein